MATSKIPLISQEKRAITLLSMIMGVRMLGLFMVLPVLALTASQLEAATPPLIGLSIGVYGLSQALLQFPFGILSDKIGRKPMILLGLSLLIIGSLIAANATTIYTLILGRALQGSGAIGAALMACLSDVTRPTVRTRAMAFLGASIGLSFVLAFVLGPVIYDWTALSGIFYATAILSVLAVMMTFYLPAAATSGYLSGWTGIFQHVLTRFNLWRLFFSVLSLHALLSATFIYIPQKLKSLTTIPAAWIYCGTLVVALGMIMPLLRRSDGRTGTRSLFLGALLAVCLSALYLMFTSSLVGFVLGFIVFFGAFCLLEAWLPSLTSQLAEANYRGATLGVFSTCQFLGIFIGGALGGIMLEQFGLAGLQLSCLALTVSWFALSVGFKFPE